MSANIKEVTSDQRDDWDVFHPKAMSRRADSSKHLNEVREGVLESILFTLCLRADLRGAHAGRGFHVFPFR